MKQIKFPSTLIIVISSLAAFWLAGIINAGFNVVGIMILLFIPVFIANYLFPDQEFEKIIEPAKKSIENEHMVSEKTAPGELVDSIE